MTLKTSEVAEVTAALARYEQALADLEAGAQAGIASLRTRRAPRVGRGGR